MLIAIALSNAVRGIRNASATSALAVGTIAIVLMLVGSARLLVGNMDGILDEVGSNLQVTAFLEPGLSDNDQRGLATRVAGAPGVESVVRVSEDEALERFERLAGGAELLTGLESNPLPASLEIHLLPESRTVEAIEILEQSLDGLPGIDELSHGQEWIEGYARAVSFIQGGATGISLVLGLAALLIVANTIRLAVYSRKDELDILALVGASRTFVRVPFILEGTIQGLLGGAIALLLIFGAYEWLMPEMSAGLELVMGRAELRFFTTAESIKLVASGGGLGFLGSVGALVGWRG
jgi:cell division transport system permease protein